MKKLAIAFAVGTCVSAVTAQAQTNLQVQSSFNAGDWAHVFLSEEWAPKLAAMTGGEVTLEVLPGNAVVPHRETIDAVANGILSGDLNSVSYFSGRDPAFAIIGDLIAGYDTVDQVQTFCRYGGGKEMLQKLYDIYANANVHVVGCGAFAREALVSSVEMRSIEDMQGVKIRAPEGMAAEVFSRAGATPVSLPLSEVYTSLDKGLIDAADASSLVNNHSMGMQDIAFYPLYPGIHSMAVQQLVFNKDVWDGLTEDQQTMVELWYHAAFDAMRREAALEDEDIAEVYRAESEVTVIDWPTSERARLREIAVGAWDEFASRSELAAEALDVHLSYMRRIGLLTE